MGWVQEKGIMALTFPCLREKESNRQETFTGQTPPQLANIAAVVVCLLETKQERRCKNAKEESRGGKEEPTYR